MANKIWDIKPANDDWERYYAKLEYLRIMWHDLWNHATHIEVSYE